MDVLNLVTFCELHCCQVHPFGAVFAMTNLKILLEKRNFEKNHFLRKFAVNE